MVQETQELMNSIAQTLLVAPSVVQVSARSSKEADMSYCSLNRLLPSSPVCLVPCPPFLSSRVPSLNESNSSSVTNLINSRGPSSRVTSFKPSPDRASARSPNSSKLLPNQNLGSGRDSKKMKMKLKRIIPGKAEGKDKN